MKRSYRIAPKDQRSTVRSFGCSFTSCGAVYRSVPFMLVRNIVFNDMALVKGAMSGPVRGHLELFDHLILLRVSPHAEEHIRSTAGV